jgi:hypoxia up-regulated 1
MVHFTCSNVGAASLSSVHVEGVAEALAKYADNPKVETKGVKAHFHLDDSGFINITAIESVFERTVSVEEQEEEERKKEEEEKTTPTTDEAIIGDDKEKKPDDSWLGDTISSFFNKEEGADKDKKGKEKSEKDKTSKDGKNDKEKDKEEKKKAAKKPKIETYKVDLTFKEKIMDLKPASKKHIKESLAKLKVLNDHDNLKKKRETALNSLESFVIDAKDKLYQEVWEDSVTEVEKEAITAKCTEISDWIDDEVMPDTELKLLEAKLTEIKVLTAPWFARVREHMDRPEVLEALDKMIGASLKFHDRAKDATGDDIFFTEVELQTLKEKIEEMKTWRDESVADQQKQPKNEMPKLTTNVLADKAMEMERELKYLVSKARIAKAERDKEREKKAAEEKKAKEEEEKKKKKEKRKKKKQSNQTTTEAEGTEGETGTTEEASVTEEPITGDDEVPEVHEEPTDGKGDN